MRSQNALQTLNLVFSTRDCTTPVQCTDNSFKPVASSNFSLRVIGIGSIVYGCADLVVCFMTLCYYAELTDPWCIPVFFTCAGFLLGVVSGSLALKAVSVEPHKDLYWTNVAFIFGIPTLVLHGVNAALYLFNLIVNLDEHEMSPLFFDAPRLVIVSVLLSLDIWLLVVTSKLRNHYSRIPSNYNAASVVALLLPPGSHNAEDDSNAFPKEQREAQKKTNMQSLEYLNELTRPSAQEQEYSQQLGSGCTALIVCGYLSILYGVMELTIRLILGGYAENLFLLSFTVVSFAIAVANGELALRAAYMPNIGTTSTAQVVGIILMVTYSLAILSCLCTMLRRLRVSTLLYLISYVFVRIRIYST